MYLQNREEIKFELYETYDQQWFEKFYFRVVCHLIAQDKKDENYLARKVFARQSLKYFRMKENIY